MPSCSFQKIRAQTVGWAHNDGNSKTDKASVVWEEDKYQPEPANLNVVLINGL